MTILTARFSIIRKLALPGALKLMAILAFAQGTAFTDRGSLTPPDAPGPDDLTTHLIGGDRRLARSQTEFPGLLDCASFAP